MAGALRRPEVAIEQGKGLLRHELLQMAYVTTDIERAKAVFAERHGITAWTQLKGTLPEGGDIHIELAWCGGIMYELMASAGSGSDIYIERLPKDNAFHLLHHHLGFIVHNAEEYAALEGEAARGGAIVRTNRNNEGFMRVMFVQAPEFDHLLEYLFPEPAGTAFFNNVARN